MASLEELEARVTALEEQVRQSRQDATAARVLAGAADRDVSEFKQLLNALIRTTGALRETQVEDHKRLADLEGKVDSGFTKVTIGMEQISRLLQQVVDKG
ncbi:hypothetical protein AB0F15_04455 [Amycolatopsis sp. NPDC026612]|uniref:hypothetical protein n=1 Tax=Amycolatopsis sp. NPDC026612 TaxID=3155466 RepID=UPI0033FDE33D